MKTRFVQRSSAVTVSLFVLGAIVMSSGCGQTTSQPAGTTMTDSMKSDGMMKDGTMTDGMKSDGMMKDGMMKDGMMKDGMMKDGMMKDGMMKDGMAPAAGEMKSDKKM